MLSLDVSVPYADLLTVREWRVPPLPSQPPRDLNAGRIVLAEKCYDS